ncbi:MAG: NADH-quinone oxidoreductase subunit A [Bradymonadia bacterium]|jgi:NADH-quinone oxidoreductase subunit A
MVDYIAVLMLFGLGAIMCAVVVGLSVFFGPKNPSRWKETAYESGSEPFGDARLRFDIKFYMIAISFIMFDVEAVFLLPWAVSAKSTGAVGFVAAMMFITILTAGLVYEWRKGGLEWD